MIYVDPLKNYPSGSWCHMMSTGDEQELIAFALSIGLKREWIQRPGSEYVHFDLRPAMRARAVLRGAVETSSTGLVKLCVRPKRLFGAEEGA